MSDEMTPLLRKIDPDCIQMRTMGQRYAAMAFERFPNDDITPDALDSIEVASRESLRLVIAKHGGNADDLTAALRIVATEFSRCYLALQLEAQPAAGRA